MPRSTLRPYQMVLVDGVPMETISMPTPDATIMVRVKDDPTTMREVPISRVRAAGPIELALRAIWTTTGEEAAYERFTRGEESFSHTQRRLLHVRLFLAQVTAAVACHYHGHAIETDNAIGPDSGSEHHYCTRCGWSWSHIYY